MRLLKEFPQAAAIDTVFTDIDDTLTRHGRLTATAYAALENLQCGGLRVVPITGRPAGWCDHIARTWPVDGVIGENGACHFWYDREARKLRQRHLLDAATRAENASRLARMRDLILREVPGCAVASDQFCRLYDLAIDFCEDVPALPRAAVDRIVELMTEDGMSAKISSIHVNGWYGDYDKLSMTRLFVREQWRVDLDEVRQRCIFVGDSPNDAPMFRYFPHSVGVANVLEFADRLEFQPTYVTGASHGDGFAELAACLLAARVP